MRPVHTSSDCYLCKPRFTKQCFTQAKRIKINVSHYYTRQALNLNYFISVSDDDEIDPDDIEIQSMTATLTRRQSETVRKRIRSLNETLKRKRRESLSQSKRPDVRDIFPTKQQSDPADEPITHRVARQELPSSNLYCVSIEPSSASSDESVAVENYKYCSDKKDVDGDGNGNEYSLRRLPELMANMFYTPEPEGKPHFQKKPVRPPGPRRTRSEGMILEAEEVIEPVKPKLDHTKSEGSPLMGEAGTK